MLYQAIRPKTFKEIVGNKAVVTGLQKVVASKPKKRPHTYLFHGPTGCGKTTFARVFARELGCEDMGLIELNAANTRGIDSIREVCDSALTGALFGSCKCYIFDESHQLTKAAQEALLKIIEDCPPHVYFMFCTTDPDKIIKTIKNRCAKYGVKSLRPSEMRDLLTTIADIEKMPDVIDDEVINLIAKVAEGCPREAIMILEQVRDYDTVAEIEEAVEVFAVAESTKKEVLELCKAITGTSSNRWRKCLDIYKALQADPETVRLSLLGYLKSIMLNSKSLDTAARAAEMIIIFEKNTYSGGQASIVRMIFEATLVQ